MNIVHKKSEFKYKRDQYEMTIQEIIYRHLKKGMNPR